MKLYYFSNSVLPSKSADSVNVMNTSAELSKLVTTISTSGISGGKSDKETFKYYGVSFRGSLLRFNSFMKKGSLYFSGLLDALRVKFQKPDLVYGRSIFSALMMHRLRVSFNFECHDAKWLVNERFESLYNVVFNSPYLERLVVVSDKLRELTLAQYPRFQNYPLEVIRNGASIPTVVSLNKTNRNIIGYVGGLYEGRGLDVIVEIAKQLPEYKFELAGGTNEELRALLRSNEIPKNIQCLGYLNPSDTAVFRNRMSILLAPYQLKTLTKGGTETTAYMSPIKIFEYMSSKTPIISSDLPVIREVLNEDNSLLVAANQVDKWVEAIGKLSNDTTLANTLATNAYEFFRNNLTWEARAKNILSFISK